MTIGQGGTTEKALEWIDQHSEDPDFNEELRVVGQSEGDNKPKNTMTKEEKLAKAKMIQDQIRKKRL